MCIGPDDEKNESDSVDYGINPATGLLTYGEPTGIDSGGSPSGMDVDDLVGIDPLNSTIPFDY